MWIIHPNSIYFICVLSLEKIKADQERNGWITIAATFLLNRLPQRFPLNLEMITAGLLDPEIQHLSAIDEWLEENNETRLTALTRIASEMKIDINTDIDSLPLKREHHKPKKRQTYDPC